MCRYLFVRCDNEQVNTLRPRKKGGKKKKIKDRKSKIVMCRYLFVRCDNEQARAALERRNSV